MPEMEMKLVYIRVQVLNNRHIQRHCLLLQQQSYNELLFFQTSTQRYRRFLNFDFPYYLIFKWLIKNKSSKNSRTERSGVRAPGGNKTKKQKQ